MPYPLFALPLFAGVAASPCDLPIFSTAETSFVGARYVQSDLIADFNADGTSDQVLSYVDETDTRRVRVLLGGARGPLLTPGSTTGLGVNTVLEHAVDVTGDGIPDVVGWDGSNFAPRFAILPSVGDGTFASPIAVELTPLVSGSSYLEFAYNVFDYDHDGDADLVYWYWDQDLGAGLLEVLANNGAGSFTPSPGMGLFLPGGYQDRVEPIVFDDNPVPDLWFSGQAPEYVATGLGLGQYGSITALTDPRLAVSGQILANVGTDADQEILVREVGGVTALFRGGFDGSRLFDLGLSGRPTALQLADFDADGDEDLVAFEEGSFTIAESRPQFEDYANPTTHTPPLDEGTFADVTGDGSPDLVSGLACVPGIGPGAFPDRVRYPTSGQAALDLIVADLNADGDTDWVVLHNQNSQPEPVEVMIRQSDGSYVSAGTFAAGDAVPTALAVGDLNGDGRPDIVTAGKQQIAVMLTQPDGTPSAPTVLTGSANQFPTAVVIGDINGDTHADVITFDATSFFPIAFIFPGIGDGTFGAVRQFVMPVLGFDVAAYDARLADVDADGDLDLIALRTRFEIFLNPGDGVFTTAAVSIPLPSNVSGGFERSDLDGDGDADYAVVNNAGVFLIENLGAGQYADAVLIHDPLGGARSGPEIADLDADGNPEIVARQSSSPSGVAVLRQTGDTIYSAITRVHQATQIGQPVTNDIPLPHGFAVQDVNLDGLPDLVLVARNEIQVELNSGCAFRTACPIDLDANTTINLDDLELFVQAFLSGSPRADLSGPHGAADGALNFDDIDRFVEFLLAGCE